MNRVSFSNTYRPQLRADVVLGPALWSNGTTVHYLKDGLTSWYYRLGVKEYFLVSKMDGHNTLEELSAAYATTFGRHLDTRSWQQIFALLENRQLLMDETDPAKLASLKELAQQKRRQESRTLARWRFSLANPDAFLQTILPWLRFIYKPWFILPALLAFVVLESFLLLNSRAIFASLLTSTTVSTIAPLAVIFLIVEWTFATVHEIAHGLTCKHFGGSVREMGITCRYLWFFPYTNLDDVVLIHNRWHRVYTACAGIFVNLLMLVPFALLWWVAPAHSLLRGLSAIILFGENVSILTNFIPFIDLDGYYILNYALNMVDLRPQAYRFLLRIIRKAFLSKRQEAVPILDSRSFAVYLIYGIGSAIYTIIFITFAANFWFTTIRQWLGSSLAWYLLSTVILFLALITRPGSQKFLPWHKKSLRKANAHGLNNPDPWKRGRPR